MNQAEILYDIIESLDDIEKLPKKKRKPAIIKMINAVTVHDDFDYEVMKQKVEKLTQQEKVILKYVIDGFTSKEIGDLLFISKHTVDTHRRHIRKKLNEKNSSYLKNYTSLLMLELNN